MAGANGRQRLDQNGSENRCCGAKSSVTATGETIGACFRAERLTVAHHSAGSVHFASTVGIALAFDQNRIHGCHLERSLLSMPAGWRGKAVTAAPQGSVSGSFLMASGKEGGISEPSSRPSGSKQVKRHQSSHQVSCNTTAIQPCRQDRVAIAQRWAIARRQAR